jgi:PEP-CTERM motif
VSCSSLLTITIATIPDHKEVNMKTQLRIASFSLFIVLCLTLATGSAFAQALYDNGAINGKGVAFEIDGAITVSDSFTLAGNSSVTGFDFGVWVLQGETPLTVDWSITSNPRGGTVYGSGTANLTNVFHNSYNAGGDSYTFNIFDSSASISLDLGPGNYWLNLNNGTGDEGGLGMYWDINSGTGCGGSDGHGADCPSLATTNLVGTIPSESFTINGSDGGGSTPEPSSFALFGSGVLGLAGVLRRRLIG